MVELLENEMSSSEIYLRNPEYERLATQAVEVKRMLSSLMQKVKVVN